MAFDERKPTSSSGGVSANMDATRANLIYMRECLVAGGAMPGYDCASGDITYNADGTVATVLYKEQTAIATANNRNSGTRYYFRKTHTYTSGRLTKTRYEISANSGSSYSNWADAAGNAYLNRTYDPTTGRLDTRTWATS